MAFEFHEAYQLGVRVISVISIGTIWKSVVWLRKQGKENQENRVLDTFGNRNWPWLSGCGVVARMKHDAVYTYARAAFPPPVTDSRSFVSWVLLVPHRFRYFCHRTLVIPNKRKADKILRDLFKRRLLICAPDNPNVYQLSSALKSQ